MVKINFSVVRYGNVALNSRGICPIVFLKMKKMNRCLVTDKNMTRFNLTLSEWCEILKLLKMSSEVFKGEIFVPKIPNINNGLVNKQYQQTQK